LDHYPIFHSYKEGEQEVKRVITAAAALAAAAVVAAGLAAAAPPANGRLIVTSPVTNVGAATRVHLTSILAPNTYRTTIYVPAGYRAPGDVGTVGNNVGKAQVFLKDSDGNRVTLNGQLSVVNASQYPATGCTASPTHHEVWVLKATQTSGTATVTFPVFVDTQESSNLPASVAYTLQYCTGNLGQNISEVDLDLVRMFDNPQARGMYTWRAVYEPAGADGKPSTTQGVLAASAVPVSAQVSMKVSRVARASRTVTLTGNVTAARAALGGVRVQLFAGRSSRLALNRPRATVRTKADGSYRVTLHLGRGTWYARAKASTPYLDITAAGCADADSDKLAAKGCVDETLAPFIVQSKPLKQILR
jgi:hypothetical protein